MVKTLFAGTLFLTASAVSAVTASLEPDNLASAELFSKQLSWRDTKLLWQPYRNQKFKIQDGILQLQSLPGGKTNSAGIPLDIDYETADAFEVSFQYRSSGICNAVLRFSHPEKELLHGTFEFKIPVSQNWKAFRRIFRRPAESYRASLSFLVKNGNGKLELKELKVKPIEPVSKEGKPVILDGQKCTAIYYYGSNIAEKFYNHRAAKRLRSEIFRAGGELLPLKFGDRPTETAITIGGNAAPTLTSGGYELKISKGKASITGLRPGGTALGALALLNQLGITYITPLTAVYPAELKAPAIKAFFNPAIPFRLVALNLCRPELLGYSPVYEIANDDKLGVYRGFGHTGPYFLPYEEFASKHPEYFALQENGERLKKIPGRRFDVHFCMSNKEGQKIIADRMIEYMKTEPLATYFGLSSGDGGGLYCRCPECMKFGNTGERNIAWVNAVAKRIAKIFPEKKITTFAYVDSRFPPENIKPAPNVIVLYCPYEPVWMNHLITNHPANAQGLKELAEWEATCPNNMGAFVYPSSCREKLNIWPAFYANYEKYKRFAEKHYNMIQYCGMFPIYGSGQVPAANNFCDLSFYVLGKVLRDPQTNIEKEIDFFMMNYYGAAAPAMRRYFDLIHREVIKRNWEQNTEKIVRGLVTPELAKAGYQCFADAEKSVSGAELVRVKREKMYLLWHDLTDNCRGNGRISGKELPAYASKLAEFCRIAKELGASYNTIPYDKWFWDTAMLRLEKKGKWFDDPAVKKLTAAPLDTLLNSIPNMQKEMPYGYFIENQGILGGERQKTNWLRKDSAWVSILRRPSSGLGTAQLNLKLEQLPAKAIVMKISGIDNEKKDFSRMELRVNGKKVFQGRSPWKKDIWSEAEFQIPAAFLICGDNNIAIMNTTPDKEVDGIGGVNYIAKRNYYWGWFMIADVKIELQK